MQYFLICVLLQAQCFPLMRVIADAKKGNHILNLQPSSQQIDTNQIISNFMAGETELRQSFALYSFKRDLLIQSIGSNGKVTGEYHRVSQFFADRKGKRQEKVISFPKPTLTEVTITEDDIEDFNGASQFLVASPGASNYEFSFVKQEQVQGVTLYIFDVKPRFKGGRKERLFEGRIWVEAKSMRVIVLYGHRAMRTNQVFPLVRINRVSVGGNYYPSDISADQTLTFSTGGRAHLRISARYSDYSRT